MARLPRTHVVDGWYEVSARGWGGQAIFRDAAEGADFMARLWELSSRFGVEVHAYVLLPDHYHLLLRTPRGNLSRAVQWLNTGYGIWWSRRHHPGGRVFHGRFRSVLLEEGSSVLEASLRLHLAPVVGAQAGAAGPDADPAVARQRRQERLRGWRWSSYRAYAGLQAAPDGLVTAAVLALGPGDAEGYAAQTEVRLEAPGVERPAARLRGARAGRASLLSTAAGAASSPPSAASDAQWARIVVWVEARRGTAWSYMCARRGEWGRELAWWAGRRCAELTLKELGARAGGVHYVAVAKALERFEARLAGDPERAAAVADLLAYLRNV